VETLRLQEAEVVRGVLGRAQGVDREPAVYRLLCARGRIESR
jgi:hypothetical protein